MSQAATRIRTASRVLIACHVRPDGDALGSLLGLALGLQSLGKEVTALSTDGVPALYRFLPHWEEIVPEANGTWDVSIGLDADGSNRLGAAEGLVLSQPFVIDLDHHGGPRPFGDLQIVDTTASATGELVFELLRELDVPLTTEIAECLMTAILTDTGSFRFTNVTADTFRIASELRACGAAPAPIYEATYGTRSLESTVLLGRFLARAKSAAGGQVVYSSIGFEEFAEVGAPPDATEGFLDQLRCAEGNLISLFLREESPGLIRVSLRSRGAADVARIAAEFGGGGHRMASGCTLFEPIETAVERVVQAAVRHLN